MIIKIFTQPNCPNCPPVKVLGKKLEDNGFQVNYYNTKEPAGLTEAVMHNLMSTPSVVVVDDKNKEKAVFRSKTPTYEEIISLKK